MNSNTTDFRKRFRGITVRSFAVALCGLAILCPSFVAAGTITTSVITAENSIVNTGKPLVSAANFGEAAVDINGLVHGAGSAAGANLTENFFFEGDFRNGQSGLGGNLETLLSGIAGANPIAMDIGGLTVGQDYLFQTYWESNPGQSLVVAFEGVDTLGGIADQPTGVVISYEFTAGDDTLNVAVDRDDALGGDPNNWLSGYSLQEYAPPPPPGTITMSVITDESSIVNTGGALVSAANLGSQAGGNSTVDINGIIHPVASAANNGNGADLIPELTINSTFDGNYRSGNAAGAGYTDDLLDLMGGIAGNGAPGPISLTISGLTPGTDYLFQGYWEANNFGQTVSVTFEGTDTLEGITGEQGLGTLISYAFTASDTVLTASLSKTAGNDNNWWLGYSLQEVPPVPEPSTFALAALGLLGLGWCGRRRRRRAA